jgi:hypothetical protein
LRLSRDSIREILMKLDPTADRIRAPVKIDK